MEKIKERKDTSIPLYTKRSKNSSGIRQERTYIFIFYGVFFIVSLVMNLILMKVLLEKFRDELLEVRNFQKVHHESPEAPRDYKMQQMQKDLNNGMNVANENFKRLPEEEFSKEDQENKLEKINLDTDISQDIAKLANRNFFIKGTIMSHHYDYDDEDYGQDENADEMITDIGSQVLENKQDVHPAISGEKDIHYVVNGKRKDGLKIKTQDIIHKNNLNNILLDETANVPNKFQFRRLSSSVPLLNDVRQKSMKKRFKVNYGDTGKINRGESNDADKRETLFFHSTQFERDTHNIAHAKFLRASFINKQEIRIMPGEENF